MLNINYIIFVHFYVLVILCVLESSVIQCFHLISSTFIQTYRELLRLTDGVGFRVHIIDKASLAAKKYGPHSNKKYGREGENRECRIGSKKTKYEYICVASYIFRADILISTPNRLIFLLKQDPPALDLSR